MARSVPTPDLPTTRTSFGLQLNDYSWTFTGDSGRAGEERTSVPGRIRGRRERTDAFRDLTSGHRLEKKMVCQGSVYQDFWVDVETGGVATTNF